jgi:hypothetical protein
MKPFLAAAMLAAALAGCAQQPQPEEQASGAIQTQDLGPISLTQPTASAQPTPSDPATPTATATATQEVPMAPMITGPINGYYQGRVREVDAKAPNCSAATRGVIEIGDKTLLYAYSPQLIYVASVQPDGTVHAEAGGTTLDGTLVDGHLAFNVTTQDCKTSFDFVRRRGF